MARGFCVGRCPARQLAALLVCSASVGITLAHPGGSYHTRQTMAAMQSGSGPVEVVAEVGGKISGFDAGYGYIVSATGSRVTVFDAVSNGNSEVGHTPPLGGQVDRLAMISNDRVMAVLAPSVAGTRRLLVIDVSNPRSPRVVEEGLVRGAVDSMVVVGDYIWLTQGVEGVRIYHVPRHGPPVFDRHWSPPPLDGMANLRTTKIAHSGDLVAVAETGRSVSSDGHRVHLLRVAEPGSIELLNTVDLPTRASNIWLDADRLVIITYGSPGTKMLVFDVSDPRDATLVLDQWLRRGGELRVTAGGLDGHSIWLVRSDGNLIRKDRHAPELTRGEWPVLEPSNGLATGLRIDERRIHIFTRQAVQSLVLDDANDVVSTIPRDLLTTPSLHIAAGHLGAWANGADSNLVYIDTDGAAHDVAIDGDAPQWGQMAIDNFSLYSTTTDGLIHARVNPAEPSIEILPPISRDRAGLTSGVVAHAGRVAWTNLVSDRIKLAHVHDGHPTSLGEIPYSPAPNSGTLFDISESKRSGVEGGDGDQRWRRGLVGVSGERLADELEDVAILEPEAGDDREQALEEAAAGNAVGALVELT